MKRAPKTVRSVAREALREHKKHGGHGRKAPAFARKLSAGRTLSREDLAKMAFMGKHRAGKSGERVLGRMYGGKKGARWASDQLDGSHHHLHHKQARSTAKRILSKAKRIAKAVVHDAMATAKREHKALTRELKRITK